MQHATCNMHYLTDLNVVLGEARELMDCREQLNELLQPLAEQVEFAENRTLVEVELLDLFHRNWTTVVSRNVEWLALDKGTATQAAFAAWATDRIL